MDSENKYLLLISVGPKTAKPLKRSPAGPLIPRTKPVRPRPGAQRASSEQQRSKVGFPIRKFTDQSLFAAPHDLSQRTTSFIASQRQGIHRIPLRHLIALIAKARFHKHRQQRMENKLRPPFSNLPMSDFAPGVEKTSFASNASGSSSGQAPSSRLVARIRRTEN